MSVKWISEAVYTRRAFLGTTLVAGLAAISASVARGEATDPADPPQAGDPVADAGVRTPDPVAEASEPIRPVVDVRIHLNQIGFQPYEPKRAVVAATGTILREQFTLLDDAVVPAARFTAKLVQCPGSGPYGHYTAHYWADFSEFDRPGRYRLRLSDGHLSHPFTIGRDIYDQLTPLVLSYFDVQRCGANQRSTLRGPCHVDDGVAVGGPRDGQPLDASGGWHDAGDYLKFVETTSYVAAMMLFGCDRFVADPQPSAPLADGLGLGTAASDSSTVIEGDVGSRLRSPVTVDPAPLHAQLVTARVGLEWLIKMHPAPDEFYYQVGDASDHDSWRLPEKDTVKADPGWKPRQVLFGVGANLAGRTAALAMGSRLYRSHDADFADLCLTRAQTAFDLGLRNPKIVTTNPDDFYPETTWVDDMEWGAAALYAATNDPRYRDQAIAFAQMAGPAGTYTSVYNVHAMAHYTLYPFVSPDIQALLLGYLRADADMALHQARQNPYGLGSSYVWGTGEAASGAAISCRLYAELADAPDYLEIARQQRDFILGCNPFGVSCLIGAGTKYPLFPHHQIANIRGIELPGAVVAGPSDFASYTGEHISVTDVEFPEQTPSPIPDTDAADEVGVYHDVVEDYVTNEPANDYTVKFLVLTQFYGGGDLSSRI